MRETPLTIMRGDTVPYPVAFYRADGVTPVNITGWTVFFTVKASISDPDASAKIAKSVTTHTDPVNGQTLVTLTAAETAALVPDTYEYDVQVKNTSNEIFTVLRGKFIVTADVTIRTSA